MKNPFWAEIDKGMRAMRRPVDSEFMTQSQLLESGWTKGIIAKYLGEPNTTRNNPNGPHRIKLYDIDRVREAETGEAKDALADAAKRRQQRQKAAAKAVRTKTDRVLSEVRSATIELSGHIPDAWDALVALAHRTCDNHQCHDESVDAYEWRVVGNYVRHYCVRISDESCPPGWSYHYDGYLSGLRGRVGGSDAYGELRWTIDRRVDDLIAERVGVVGVA